MLLLVSSDTFSVMGIRDTLPCATLVGVWSKDLMVSIEQDRETAFSGGLEPAWRRNFLT